MEWLALLLQKERDLNTAARIGQSLVKQNSVLMEENNKLETMLGSAREEVSGLLRTKRRIWLVPSPNQHLFCPFVLTFPRLLSPTLDFTSPEAGEPAR